ncbi:carboxylesterase 5A-like [Arapaima gigas]
MTLLGSLLLAAFLAHTQADQGPEVCIQNGTLRGQYITVLGTEKVVQQYLGIPFALAPVGPLRLRPPQPPKSWEGIRDATQQPPLLKLVWNFSIPDMSEDCLYLNVYTPSNRSASERLPVMVWIHGGALVAGGAALTDGSPLAAYQNVVVVVIQYRLGILGFFSTGDEHAKGNWGFLDQIAALQWVQENIESFGGDPKSVTIFGVSAGAVSVSMLILSPLSSGLFHKAIVQSGVACLHIFSSSRLRDLAQVPCDCCHSISEYPLSFIYHFSTALLTVDGDFMKEPVEEILKSKAFQKIPIVLGVTNHEAGWMLSVSLAPPGWEKGMDKQTVMSIMNRLIPAGLLVDEYLRDAKTPEDVRDAFTEIIGDVMVIFPSLVVALHHRGAGLPVYLYEFQHVPLLFKGRRPNFVRSDHGDEVSFVFGAAFWNGHIKANKEGELSKKMMAYWANFARTGSPNGPGLTLWPEYGKSEEYLKLALEQTVGSKLKQQKFHFISVTLPKKLAEMQAASTNP